MSDYSKTFVSELHDFFEIDKSIPVNDDVAELLRYRLNSSPYTTGELAARLNISLEDLELILRANKTLTIYDMVHVAGALGFKFEFNLIKDVDYAS